jgi:hypothetical protein
VDDEPFNLQSLKIHVELACKNLGYPAQVVNSLIDTAKDGLESYNRV